MKNHIRKYGNGVALLLFALVFTILALTYGSTEPARGRTLGDISNADGLHLQGNFGTATPALLVDQQGTGKILELKDDGTTVFSVNDGGAVSMTGSFSPSGGQSVSPNLVVAAPTSIGTATPVIIANSASGLSNLFEARAASTPQVVIGPAGIMTLNAGVTNNAWSRVAAPTSIATQTPVAVVDSAGGVSNLLEVRKSATPQFTVHTNGNVTGKVLRYSTAGEQLVTGTSLVTGTATASHGLTTVTFALCTLGEDPTAGAGDGAMCTVTVSANVVTLKVWQDDFVTAASEQNVDVHWLAVGTP